MTTEQKTALLWALALLVWVLAFAGLIAMLGRADGLAVATRLLHDSSSSSPQTVRPVEYRDAVRSVGPLRSQTLAITHLAVGPSTDTPPRPAAPLSGRRMEAVRIE